MVFLWSIDGKLGFMKLYWSIDGKLGFMKLHDPSMDLEVTMK